MDLAGDLAAGTLSAERVTRVFLGRIAALDDAGPALGAVIEVNPDALEIARGLDRRRRGGGPVEPLHGVPVLLKANIDTADALATSAGSLALAAHHAGRGCTARYTTARGRRRDPRQDQPQRVGEFSRRRVYERVERPGDQTRNPYVLDRSPCGSSSGSAAAVAAPPRSARDRHGDRRLDGLSGRRERRRRRQTDAGL